VHHKKIQDSDAIYVYNPDSEIGKNTSVEFGYALALNKPIFAFKKTGEHGIDCFVQKFISPEELKKL
jgi:nucleoside 2-deoxyribosyltransferase